ncbi:hypothetical protein [Bacillus thuringiensis]|nr:hypothetical protein [Bacillus thuringiensis]RKI20813.1 hypothetical protein D7V71_26885 [Bacillus thuringiensis]
MKSLYKPTGKRYGCLGMFFFIFSVIIAFFTQIQTKAPQEIGFNEIMNILFLIVLLMYICEKVMNHTFNRDVLFRLFFPLVGIIGSLHSILDICYKMGLTPIKFLYINSSTNFTSMFFFAIYTLLYNWVIID